MVTAVEKTLSDQIQSWVGKTGYDDPLDDLLSAMLVEGWRYEDDWYSPERLREMLEAAGLRLVKFEATDGE